MKKINLEAAQVFNCLIKRMKGKDYLKLDNSEGFFLPIIIEKLSEDVIFGSLKIDFYSLSHYYMENGDLVPDPDMLFAVNKTDCNSIWPFTFQDRFIYEECVYQDKLGVWKVNNKMQAHYVEYAEMWLRYVQYQQNI